MADGVFNIAKGKVNGYVDRVADNDPANAGLVVMILKTAEADSTLRDYDTFAAILAGANTEADFTNYARKELTDADVSNTTVDDVNDRREADIPDQTWASAGGASNNTTAKIIIGYVADITSFVDADVVPLTHHDFVETTDGNDLVAQVNSAGFFRAA